MIKQDDLLSGVEEENASYVSGPVECLGMTFDNDEKRREYFTGLLREKLKDPEFRKIEGFPIGEDEDILNLSDPPYYTACPNPFIGQFVKLYGTPYDPEEEYSREPYAADVSEGKNDPIYNAHSYHTKVPHKAIMRYILHYTKPGDLVFDGFCGTGMTGVAAQICDDKATVESLGYKVLADGTILVQEEDENGQIIWKEFSKLGARKTILNDLSPAAGLISSNFNTPVDERKFNECANSILEKVKSKYSFMYRTLRHDIKNYSEENMQELSERILVAKTKGQVEECFSDHDTGLINFVVWSDVFVCPQCTTEIVFWDEGVDIEAQKIKDTFLCSSCNTELTKRNLERAWINKFDFALGDTVKIAKQQPVLINYCPANSKQRLEKKPDAVDIALLAWIEKINISEWYPTERMMDGKETRRNDSIGVKYVHQFYSDRNLIVMSKFRDEIFKNLNNVRQLGMWFTSSHVWGTRLNRLLASNYFKKRGGVIGQTLQGTLYISSIGVETNLIERFKLRISSVPFTAPLKNTITQTSSSTDVFLPSNSLDYIFIDPPFGANIMYSELNSLWEYWIKVKTNINKEAIENSTQKKGANEYRQLMSLCFKEFYRVLKPGRWITVEFSNTKASVWNSIQIAMNEAGFIVATVSALEKNHKGFRAVTTPTAVKQDLVITAYKPSSDFEQRFNSESSEDGVWDFVRNHLNYLPVSKHQAGELVTTPERDPRILFDQMVAYFVRHGRPVPVSSPEFQAGLKERFVDRDGMIFLPDQVAEYDKKRVTAKQLRQMSIFVDDEASAIEWLRQQLSHRPMTYQDIHPLFLNELSGWKKNEKPLELRDMLEQSFIQYDGKEEVPSQIHSYLSTNHKDLRNLPKDDPKLVAKAKDRWYVPDPNKAADLEKLRERSLLKEFEAYKSSSKKIKQPRGEALRAGFKKAWETGDYALIQEIAKKIPADVLQEDEKLLMYYDNASSMSGDDDFDW